MSSSPGSEPAAGIADLLLWPWRVGRALALLPISFQLQEGPSGTAASQSSTPQAPRPLHDKLRAALQPKEYVLVVPRALHSWQAGQQVFSHALAYNAVEAGVKLLHLQPAAERLLGASHALLRGAVGYLDPEQPSHRISLMNACAATFSLQGLYTPQNFPWSSLQANAEPDLHDPGTKMAHMLALTSRLAYEAPDLARQVVEDQWGCTFVASRRCRAAEQHEAQDFATSWFAFATGSALVIAFCGEAAMHQLSWNASRQFHITKRGGLGGVDDTLFSLLLSRPKGSDGDRESLFDEVLSTVGGMLANRPLYLTGHGMGGALASLFALVLRLKRPHSSHQVAGVYTYGSCAAGDAEFVRKLQAAYPERLVAHQHPQDVCSLWCPPGGYAALPGDACSALPQDVQVARSYLQRLLSLTLRPLPGFLHHLPSEYEGALQSELLLNQYTDALPVSGPAHVILQLGSPARGGSPAHTHAREQSGPSATPQTDLFLTCSDLLEECPGPSLPSAFSTPLRASMPLQRGAAEGTEQGWRTPDSLLMAPAEPRISRVSAPTVDAQVPGEENDELAALLAEWDDGEDSCGSAQDSPRTSLMHSQQHRQQQQDPQGQHWREASSICSGGRTQASQGSQALPAAAQSARSMHSTMSTLRAGSGQELDRTEDFVGSTLQLLPSTALSPSQASCMESFYSAATAPRKVAAKAAGSGCSSDSGERIQASPSKHAGLERLRRAARGDSPEKRRLAELAGDLEGLAAAARQLLQP